MTLLEGALVLLAAVGAGALNAVVGAGTLITFPTLLALGFPPVVANVSNTVGVVPGSIAGAYAFRSQLVGRRDLVLRLVGTSAVGGIAGGTLLLALPSRAFELAVPVLLLLAGALAAVQPRVAAAVARRRAEKDTGNQARPVGRTRTDPWLLGGIALTGAYGGYFGAAQGVILLVVLGVFVEIQGGMAQLNGIKNVLAVAANVVAGLLFGFVAEVDWTVAGLIAIGDTIGGGLGGRYGRRLPSSVLRAMVVTVAFVAAAWQVST